ncbi:glycoside hydrolase family 3 protein [Jeotgalibaca sp. A127]|uniref:glycoside hydrolase family 3 protein n=1 Tax=Jeotgalibaca sp. A127 TaxID=3457324 RepID=UPI003FD6386A
MKNSPVINKQSINDGYIPAPYELEKGEAINDRYLEPVYFENENGPTIGVTTCGVIVQDGLYFKDLDNSGKMAPFKDWRLDDETRAKDMVHYLRLDQQAGLVLNTLWNTPVVPTRAEATDEAGKLALNKIYKKHDPSEPEPPSPIPGISTHVDDKDILERKITGGVYRGDMNVEAAMSALYHNAGTQMLEYEASLGGVAIPYSLHTNPINIGYPDSLGIAAAVMGEGNYDLVHEMAHVDRSMMKAAGQNVLYGPQVDIATDPRWPRNSGTYGEVPEVTAGIVSELVKGYQDGTDGLNEDSVVLTVKHFPGDGPSENGFESHMAIGQWRLYPTAGSLEKYHLPPFQAAFDLQASGIMPNYSRITTDSRTKPQTYRGKTTSKEVVATAYSKELLDGLARETMGFNGYVNSDSGIVTSQIYGVEELSIPERYAKAIAAGTDVVGGTADPEHIVEAVEKGYLAKEDLDRASYNRLLSLFKTKRVDNPYLDPEHANKVRAEKLDGAKKAAYQANQKSIVLAKNHGAVLPLKSNTKVYIACFKGVDTGAAFMAAAMGLKEVPKDDPEAFRQKLVALFEEKGHVIVDTPEEADYAYLHVWPMTNGMVFNQFAMPVIDLVDNQLFDEREVNKSQKRTGNKVSITTLKDVAKIKEISELVHNNGGKVIASCVVTSPWLLDKLEPYVDGMTFQYTTSKVALDQVLRAQVEVVVGEFSPTGKMPLTMVSSPEVIALNEVEIDGEIREVCVSPNDVPGYDKDQYIKPEILAKVKGGSYAYCDEDGNYYRAGFGLHYEA